MNITNIYTITCRHNNKNLTSLVIFLKEFNVVNAMLARRQKYSNDGKPLDTTIDHTYFIKRSFIKAC